VGAVIGEMTAQYAKDAKLSDGQALALAKTLAAASGVLVGGGGDNVGAVNAAATTGANAAENNYLKHADRLALNKAQGACFTSGDSTACSAATALQRKDQLSDKLLSNAAASCKGAECNDVTTFIPTQMNSLGCTAPNTCSDYNTLGSYLRVAQEKAQGLEPVYPEGWALDAKAVLDLGKLGVNVLSRCDDCDQQLLS
jgi:filamentous hemagglutinin